MSGQIQSARDRRRFIVEAGIAILIARSFPFMAQASVSSPMSLPDAGSLIIRSGQGFVPHTHDLLIPYKVLKAPPPLGVRLESTSALFHTHAVALTQQQLIVVSQGGTVTATGGSHSFVIALADAINR